MNGNAVSSGNLHIYDIWTGWTTVGIGDYNGDQKADILWRGPSGEIVIWIMNAFAINYRTISTP
jgi:hypothetical protein